jgi:hypothetical protein
MPVTAGSLPFAGQFLFSYHRLFLFGQGPFFPGIIGRESPFGLPGIVLIVSFVRAGTFFHNGFF